MKQPHLIWLLPIALLALVGAGCAKSAADKAAEDAIRQGTNTNADVDLSNHSVSVNVNGASWQAGESLSLPTGWPSDVYVIDGTIKSSVVIGNGYTVAISSTKPMTQAKSAYSDHLAADGWTITANATVDNNSAAIMATKGNRNLTVAISDKEPPTVVTITVVTNTATNTSAE